tara:strand:+ start:2285 stop:2455 length:171 start_codon:yes stop_codon:yes gene_type:complete
MREKLLQANINKLLYEKNEARKTIDFLNKKVAELEAAIKKPKKEKKDGQQANKTKA